MRQSRGKLLVGVTANRRDDFEPLKRYADVYWLDDLDDKEQAKLLPLIDCVYSHGWPKALDGKVSKMNGLRLYQAGNAGVSAIRFDLLGKDVTICSNAGAYSDEVAEFVIGLMLASGKSIIKFDRQLRTGVFTRKRSADLGRQVTLYAGKTLGIVGYGGIGRSTARFAKPFRMNVLAFGRHPTKDRGVKVLRGRGGLLKLLRESDVVVLAVPLTNETKGMIGQAELAAMKRDAMLINVARGEVVQKRPVYEHLVKNPGFHYATDVWWPDSTGMETFSPDLPFLELENFIGTPHASGTSAIISGSVMKGVVENLTRFYKGERLKNVVDKSEYA